MQGWLALWGCSPTGGEPMAWMGAGTGTPATTWPRTVRRAHARDGHRGGAGRAARRWPATAFDVAVPAADDPAPPGRLRDGRVRRGARRGAGRARPWRRPSPSRRPPRPTLMADDARRARRHPAPGAVRASARRPARRLIAFSRRTTGRAPVAQGIEHRPPEAGAQVRILPGAPFRSASARPGAHASTATASTSTIRSGSASAATPISVMGLQREDSPAARPPARRPPSGRPASTRPSRRRRRSPSRRRRSSPPTAASAVATFEVRLLHLRGEVARPDGLALRRARHLPRDVDRPADPVATPTWT